MTSNNHTPIAIGALANADTFNDPLSDIDTAIGNRTSLATTTKTNLVAAISEVANEVIAGRGAEASLDARFDALILAGGTTATTLTATASGGAVSLTVASISGFALGDPITVELDTGELHPTLIDQAPSGSTIHIADALPSQATSGNAVSKSIAEVVDARGGYGTLGQRVNEYPGVMRLAQSAAQHDTEVVIYSETEAVLGVAGGWILVEPWSTNCEVRKITSITGNQVGLASELETNHSVDTPALWITQPVLDALWFGAAGDGTTDDTAALLAALYQLRVLGGGTLYLSQHALSADLDLSNLTDIRITGSPDSFLKGTADDMLIFARKCSNVTIENITLRGEFDTATVNKSNQQGIRTDNVTGEFTSNLKVRNVTFNNLCGDGIRVGPNTRDVLIEGCHMEGGLGFVEIVGVDTAGDSRPAYNIKVIGGDVYASTSAPRPLGYGSDDIIDVGGGCYGILIAKNTIDRRSVGTDNHSSTGILLYGSSSAQVIRDVQIEGNIIRNCISNGSITDDQGAISLRSIFAADRIQRVVIKNNQCYNSRNGIHAYQVRDIRVEGNIIKDANQVGIELNLAHRSIAINNTVENATLQGIYAQGNYIEVKDNHVMDCTTTSSTGIYVVAGTDNLVKDNIVYNGATSGRGIYIISQTRCRVSGNILDTHPTTGLQLHATNTGVICDYNIFANNGANVVDGSTGTIWRNNSGYVTENHGTATVANGTTSIAVNHGLARTPALADIQVTPTLMSNAAKFWITNPTSSQFTVNVDADPGAGTATFVWRAMIDP